MAEIHWMGVFGGVGGFQWVGGFRGVEGIGEVGGSGGEAVSASFG